MKKVYIVSVVERNYSESAFAHYSTNVSAIMTRADFQYDAAFKKGRYKKQVWNQVIQSQHLHLTTIAINIAIPLVRTVITDGYKCNIPETFKNH